MASVLETAKENLAYGVDTSAGKYVAYIIDTGAEEDYLWCEEFDTFLDAQYSLFGQIYDILERPIVHHFHSIREQVMGRDRNKAETFEICIGVEDDK